MQQRDYERLCLSGNNFQYEDAIRYYAQKKDKILENIAKKMQKEFPQEAKKDLKNIINTLENDLTKISVEGSEVQKDLATKLLENISGQVGDITLTNSQIDKLNNAINQAKKEMEETKKKKGEDWKYVNETKTLISKIKKNLGSKELSEIFSQIKIPASYTSDKALYSQLQSYAMRSLLFKYQQITSKELYTSSYKNAIGGYFREAAVADGYLQYFNKLGMVYGKSSGKGFHATSIGGKNTEVDILFGFLDTTNKMSQSIKGEADINLSDLENELINAMQTELTAIGAQVKSWKLDDPSRNFFPIGSRSILGETVRRSMEYRYGWSEAANIAFLGEWKNILIALGKDNLMFVEGSKKYWMDEFIRYFRSKKLYLQLNMQIVGKGSDGKSKRRASNEVILYAYTKAKNL